MCCRAPIAALALLGACDSNGISEPDGPSIDEVQANVFDASCAFNGCHGGDTPAAGLDLSAGVARQNTVNVSSIQVPDLMRVEPGNAPDSYLYIKITGGDRMAENTFQMPIGGALTNDQIRLVEEWIEGGAAR